MHQLLLRPFALGDVFKNRGKLSGPRADHRYGKVLLQRLEVRLKTRRLARFRHRSIYLEIWRPTPAVQLRTLLAYRILSHQPDVPFISGIHVHDHIVYRPALFVINQLMKCNTFRHGLKQGAESAVALPQHVLGPLSLPHLPPQVSDPGTDSTDPHQPQQSVADKQGYQVASANAVRPAHAGHRMDRTTNTVPTLGSRTFIANQARFARHKLHCLLCVLAQIP